MRADRVGGGSGAPRATGAAALVVGTLLWVSCSLAIDLEPLDRGTGAATSTSTGDATGGVGTGAGAAGSTTSGGGTSQGGRGGGACVALGEACTADPCCEGECSDVKGRCCLDEGAPCTGLSETECCSGCDMARGKCCGPNGCASGCSPQGMMCQTPMDCCDGLDCTGNQCACVPVGANCGPTAHCCQGSYCVAQTCTTDCTSALQMCGSDRDCCTGVCTNSVCACSGDFQQCATDNDCCFGVPCGESGFCNM